MFKKTSLAVIAFLAVVALTATQANASLLNALVKFQDGPGTGNGGEFKVFVQPNNSTAAFHTFCVELSESIGFGTTYKINNLSMATVASNMQLTTDTAWLFRNWWNGSNAGLANSGSFLIGTETYDLGSNRHADARSLQLAIWHTMGWASQAIWTTGGYDTEYAGNAKAQSWVAQAALVQGFSNADFGVRIMNLSDPNGNGNFQDQLVVIPEPGSILIWTVAVAGIGGMLPRRRRLV